MKSFPIPNIPYPLTLVTLLPLTSIILAGSLCYLGTREQLKSITIRDQEYTLLTDTIQFEQLIFNKQAEVQHSAQMAVKDFQSAKEISLTSSKTPLNFLVLVDVKGRILQGESRVLVPSDALLKPYKEVSDGTQGTWWLPTNKPPSAPVASFGFAKSKLHYQAIKNLPIISDSIASGHALQGTEILSPKYLKTLGLQNQVLIGASTSSKTQGLAIAAVEPIPGRSYWIVAGYLINGNPDLANSAAFLSGKNVLLAAEDTIISTNILDARNRRIIGYPLPNEMATSSLRNAATFQGTVELSPPSRYHFVTNPLYDHRLINGKGNREPPVGVLGVAHSAEYLNKLVNLSCAQLDTMSVWALVGLLVVSTITVSVTFKKEAQVQVLQKRQEVILESAGNGILGFNDLGRCFFANSAALKMLDAKIEDILGQKYKDVLSTKFALNRNQQEQLASAQLKDILNNLWETSTNLGANNATELPVLIQFHISTEKQVSLVVSLSDLTERRRAEREGHEAVALAERNRIATEIHDNLGNLFASLQFQSSALCERIDAQTLRGEDMSIVRRVAAGIRDTSLLGLQAMQSSLKTLKDDKSENKSIHAALETCMDRLSYGKSIIPKFELIGKPRELDREIEKNLTLIGFELITNAIHHSLGHHLEVTLHYMESSICLSVNDDGVGLFAASQSTSKTGMGLDSVILRAQTIEAGLCIVTSPNSGTRISVTAPFSLLAQERLNGST